MKIVYIITKGTWGGAQNHLFHLIQDQVARNHEVELVVGETGRLVDEVRDKFPQVKIHHISTLMNDLKLKNIFTTIYKLRKILKHSHADIVHMHSTVAGALGRISAIGLKSKVIFTVHGSSFTPGVGKKREIFAKMVEKILLPFTNKLIFVSKFDYNLWVSQFKKLKKSNKGIVIYNGVENSVEKIKTSKRKYNNKLEICMAARFSPPKKQELLIKSIKNSPLENLVHVTFLGDGELLERCKLLGENNKAFSFKGAVQNVSKYYTNADIVALISNFEGLPISLIEALPLSKPLIASDVGGVSEIIYNNGFCVKNSEKSISDALRQVIDHPSLLAKLGKNSYRLYEKYFKIETMLNDTNKVYQELLKGKK